MLSTLIIDDVGTSAPCFPVLSQIRPASSVIIMPDDVYSAGRASQSRTRGHTTKIILWGSHSSIVISRRHTGEATTNTTSQTSTLVGANLCLLIPKPKSLANATFHNAPWAIKLPCVTDCQRAGGLAPRPARNHLGPIGAAGRKRFGHIGSIAGARTRTRFPAFMSEQACKPNGNYMAKVRWKIKK